MASLLTKLFVALAVISISVTPTSHLTSEGNAIRYANSSSASSSTDDTTNNIFYKATNDVCSNDYIKEGYGCVTGELRDYDINLEQYIYGLASQPKVLMVSERLKDNDTGVYVYVYRTDTDIEYDRISISRSTILDTSTTYEGDFLENYLTRRLEKVSYSENRKLVKYRVIGVYPFLNNEERRYSIRNIYEYEHRQDKNYFIDDVTEYLLSPDPNDNSRIVTKINSQFKINITDKTSGFQIFFENAIMNGMTPRASKYMQRFHILFNTDYNIDNLTRVALSYKYQPYNTCDTKIGYDMWDGVSNFHKEFQGPKSCVNDDVKYLTEMTVNNKYIEPQEREVKYDSGTGIWAHIYNLINSKDVITWNNISKTEDLQNVTDVMIDGTKKVTDYKWAVFFHEKEFLTTYWASGPHTYNTLRMPFIPEIKELDYSAVNVTDVNLLQLWFEENGEIKTAIVSDTYIDADKNQYLQDQQFFSFFDWLMDNWWVLLILLVVIIALPIIVSLFTFGGTAIMAIPKILKALIKIIIFPFKAIKWLFSKPKRKQKRPSFLQDDHDNFI